MPRLALLVLVLIASAACKGGAAGATCSRDSDCASGVCTQAFTCGGAADAGIDALDATTAIPPLPTDAADGGTDGSAAPDATTDAPADAGADA